MSKIWHNETVITTKDGHKYNFWKIDLDKNGNPRYLVSFEQLGSNGYLSTKATRDVGLKLYKHKLFDGCFVFTSYNLYDSACFFEKHGLYSNTKESRVTS